MRWSPLIVLLLCISCGSPHEKRRDFKALMGMGQEYVKTQEDEHNLALYQTLYDKMVPLETIDNELRIPKVIHFMWIGPYELPQKYFKVIRHWMKLHPKWNYKLWSDRPRKIDVPNLELCYVSDLSFSRLKSQFDTSLSLPERSHILRYEILFAQGGVYIDCDAKACKSFDTFHESLDFYCSLEPLHPSILSSSVTPAIHIIGAAPRHPILGECLNIIAARWDQIARVFPGNDTDSLLYKMAHRTLAPFDEALKLQIDREEYRNVIFPAAYFSMMNEQPGIYASHDRERSWLKGKTRFERDMHRKIEALSKYQEGLMITSWITLFFSFVIFSLILIQRRSR